MKFTTTNLADVSVVALLGAFAAFMPVNAEHYWFDVVAGRLIATHGLIPDQNIFAYGAPLTQPIESWSWLGKLWLYQLHNVGGLVATSLARNLCLLALFALIAVACRRMSRALSTSLVVLAFGVLCIGLLEAPSPRMFAWPLAGALAVALVSIPRITTVKRAAATVLLWVVCTALWANLADSVVVLPVALAVAAWLRHKARDEEDRHAVTAVLAGGVVASLGAALLSPYGVDALFHLASADLVNILIVVALPLALAHANQGDAGEPRVAKRRWTIGTSVGVLAVVLLQPWSDAHRVLPQLAWGERVRAEDPLRGFGKADTPVRPVEVLRTWGSQPRVLVASEHAGYVLYELQSADAPEPIVFTVPALASVTHDAAIALNADREIARGLLRQLAVEAVIITDRNRGFEPTIRTLDEWELLGEGPDGALYVRDRRAIASEAAAE